MWKCKKKARKSNLRNSYTWIPTNIMELSYCLNGANILCMCSRNMEQQPCFIGPGKQAGAEVVPKLAITDSSVCSDWTILFQMETVPFGLKAQSFKDPSPPVPFPNGLRVSRSWWGFTAARKEPPSQLSAVPLRVSCASSSPLGKLCPPAQL